MKKTLFVAAWAVVMNAGLISAAPAGQTDSYRTGDMLQMRSMSAGERNLYRQMNSHQARHAQGSAQGGRYGSGGAGGSGNQYRHQHRHQYHNGQGSFQARNNGGGHGRSRGR